MNEAEAIAAWNTRSDYSTQKDNELHVEQREAERKQREEIVRCRDCVNHEHWEYKSKPARDICTVFYCVDVSLDDFCSRGERKQ